MLAVLRSGDQVVTASRDRTAKVWDANRGELLCELEGRFLASSAIFFTDGRRMLTPAATTRCVSGTWSAAANSSASGTGREGLGPVAQRAVDSDRLDRFRPSCLKQAAKR